MNFFRDKNYRKGYWKGIPICEMENCDLVARMNYCDRHNLWWKANEFFEEIQSRVDLLVLEDNPHIKQFWNIEKGE